MWADRYRALEQTHSVIVDRWLTAEERVKELEAAIREALDPGTPLRPRREVLREALGGKSAWNG